MKKLALLVYFLFFTSLAHAELWICYDDSTNRITRRVEGDCLNLGICTGANNSGILSNCFEATLEEMQKASEQFVKVDLNVVSGPRVVDMSQAEIDAIVNAQNTAADTALREGAKSSYDGLSQEGLIKRSLLSLLVNEINILRQAIEDITVEDPLVTDKNLPPRTISQAKTAIKNAIDSGSVDNE